MTPTRLIHDDHSTIFPSSARSSRPIRELCTISARPSGPQLDRHQIFTRPERDGRTKRSQITREEVERIGY
ncbi:hypothetical protein DPMN_075948 [Dreissena polymorpha]|uniref:Uncharacterized protein n=1 Tax=Dreissena polymorpha TaxID=45954 RepID=A0A9D4BN63_DREPO|nr:hypothetical protein DPMN_075948 [Dreissena polymorpha]